MFANTKGKKVKRAGGRGGGSRFFLRKNPAVLKLYVLGHMPTQRRWRHGGESVGDDAVGAQFTRKQLTLTAFEGSRKLIMSRTEVEVFLDKRVREMRQTAGGQTRVAAQQKSAIFHGPFYP